MVLTGTGSAIVVRPSTQQQISVIPGKRNIVNQACLTAESGILAVRALPIQQNGYRHG
ncbi:TPA: hypothetical protein ACIS5M_003885 [Salmonella enterica subsp. enterica serovar Waycross]|nr:hypothetical protein [Salmonella enterica]EIZ5202625.1 hypothetical protein [Salmonella enterica]EJN6622294.1 hypothetical protein [Salmonella enterica subsp. enterica]ELJ7406787.1 hypothetical protein [Salmonella enterica]